MNGIPRVACVGAGYWGKNLVRNLHDLGALAWICERDGDRRAALAAEYPGVQVTGSLDDVLADDTVQGVAIATPAESHGELVERALLASRDVFVEKPLCLSTGHGRRLVALASERKRILMVGHLLWYHPAVLKLKELVDAGELGRIQYIYSNRLNFGKIRREENILWSFAPHDVSVILGLVGEMPEAVYAQGGNYLHNRIADVTVTVMTFASGVRAHIFVSWLHPFKEQKLVVVGDRKMAVFNDLEPKNKLLLYPHSINWKQNLPIATKAEAEVVRVEMTEPLKAECQAFVDAIVTRRAPRTDGEEGVSVLSVLETCQQSLENGHKVASNGPTSQSAPTDARRYFVHESSCVDEGAEIGEGTNIWHFSHVSRNARIGRNCRIGQNVLIGPNVTVGDGVKIQNNVSVYEGVTLEDYVFCGPSMVFTNVYNPRSEVRRMDELRPTLVRRGASLGANCTILCGVTIGQYAFVGAGAVVLKDVPDFALVVGNPARLLGWMCACGHRLPLDAAGNEAAPVTCGECGRRYRRENGQVCLEA